MKAVHIVDSLGPNPEFDPPVRKHFMGPTAAEDYADAKARYNVHRDRIVPAGTVIAGENVWMHCIPDQEGIAFRYDKNHKVVPYRKSPGVVRCVPADDTCQMEVDAYIQRAAASRGVSPDVIKAEIEAGVKRAKDLQAQLDATAAAESQTASTS